MRKFLSGCLCASFFLLMFMPQESFAALTRVGPKSTAHGFPEWYEDSRGTKLSLCLDTNTFCLPLEDVDVTRPVSFPDNFPGEAFWWAGETEVNTTGGGSVLLVMALEAAFSNEVPEEGQRVSFARIRIRGFSLPKGTYRITHPYGQQTFRVTSVTRRNINFTSDIGIEPEVFDGALRGAVGPFLRWNPAFLPKAPAGFLGDPAIPHRVTGSPRGTNFLRVERRSGRRWVRVGFTREFNIAGKIAP